MANSTVYFTNELTPEAVVKMYRQLGIELPGKVAVKVHSGEDGNQNYLHPEFMKPVIDAVNGTVVECNTAYGGARNETPKHIELMKKHHWSDLFDVDIMDAEGPDVEWPVENGKVLKVNYLGKNIENYDSMLVLIHFKGHPMGGYGGALKQLSIGCACTARQKDKALGLVGTITKVDPRVLRTLLEGGFLPVVSPVSRGEDGGALNCNADDAARAVAEAVGADKLIFLTDTDGILVDSHNQSTRIAKMDVSRAKELMDSGLIAGGMIPKTLNCIHAVEHGVGSVTVLDGRMEHAILLEAISEKSLGTTMEKKR